MCGLSDQLRGCFICGGYASLVLLGLMARAFGPGRLLPFLVRGESSAARVYADTPEAAPLVADERAYEYALRRMAGGKAGDGQPHPEGGFLRGDGGALRAAVLGINDGLVSNLSLVMGVAGGTGDPRSNPCRKMGSSYFYPKHSLSYK